MYASVLKCWPFFTISKFGGETSMVSNTAHHFASQYLACAKWEHCPYIEGKTHLQYLHQNISNNLSVVLRYIRKVLWFFCWTFLVKLFLQLLTAWIHSSDVSSSTCPHTPIYCSHLPPWPTKALKNKYWHKLMATNVKLSIVDGSSGTPPSTSYK